MRILAIERELQPIDAQIHEAILRHEAQRVWQLKKDEIIQDIWFTRSDKRAVLMLECASEPEAQLHLATLPLVREKLITFDLLALRPYDGFDRLFEPNIS